MRIGVVAVPAPSAEQKVVPVGIPRTEGVVPTPGSHDIGSSGRGDPIGTSTTPPDVCACLETDGVVPRPPVNAIGVDARANLVTPRSAPDVVVASVAVDEVTPSPSVDDVVTALRLDRVLPAKATDDIGAVGTLDEMVGTSRARDGARSAMGFDRAHTRRRERPDKGRQNQDG